MNGDGTNMEAVINGKTQKNKYMTTSNKCYKKVHWKTYVNRSGRAESEKIFKTFDVDVLSDVLLTYLKKDKLFEILIYLYYLCRNFV